jgi:sigma-E factor negative regulatory protein RseB
MNVRTVLLLALLLPCSTASAKDEDGSWLDNGRQWVRGLWQGEADQWLARINPALMAYDYNGTLVFVHGNSMESLLVEHRVQGGRESLRMQTLSGSPRELIKRNGRISSNASAGGGNGVAFMADQGTFSRFANAAGNKWYDVSLGEKTRVAGRSAQALNLRADDSLRYSYRIWLDEQTGLPLRVLTLDENGVIIEQMAFTQISIKPSADTSEPLRPSKRKVPDSPFKEVEGFKLLATEKTGKSTHYLFSDGLSSFSLYVEPSSAKEKGRMHQASINGLMVSDGNTRFVAMGKVPVATLQQALSAAVRR